MNIEESQEDEDKNNKKSLKPKYELNEIGSWLCSYPVYGDVVVCSLNCDGFNSFSKISFVSCLQASLPSGLWTNDSVNKHFVNMPLWYHSPAWSCSLRPKLPITLLHEILTRRSLEGTFQKEIIICDDNDNNNNDDNNNDNIVYEDVPENGWWKSGIIKSNNESVNIGQIENQITENNSPKKIVKIIKPEKVRIKIILPISPGLFSVSGKEYISTSEVIRGSVEASDCLQEVALEALWEIQKCGEHSLRTVSDEYRTFFYSNLINNESINSIDNHSNLPRT